MREVNININTSAVDNMFLALLDAIDELFINLFKAFERLV